MRKKNSKRVTLQDIADATGYSVNAVSRALRDKSDIGPEAKEQIREAARTMGYVANQTAVALRSGRTNIIAIILVDITNPFFSVTTDQIQIAAQEAGYSLMILCSRDDPELERQMVEQAIARCVDGVLLFPTSRSAPSIQRLKEARMPHVVLARYLEPGVSDSVIIDDEQGAYLAARHLIEAGHRKLAYIASNEAAPSYGPRKEGFVRACDEYAIGADGRRFVTLRYLHISLVHQIAWRDMLLDELLRLRGEGFTGLFIFCDIEAWRIMEVLRESGKFDIHDFGIVGFDNIDGALLSPTPLCSVDGGLSFMARESIHLLVDRINGDDRPIQTIVCPVKIVCRGSCK